jgi:hypothetical protein
VPVLTCSSCHRLDPDANPGTAAPGFFGTDGRSSFAFNPQLFKVPHLRNAYQKVGMFGNPENPGFLPTDHSFQGDQVRGFGFLHGGDVDTIFRFHHGISFSFDGGFSPGPAGDVQRRQVESFVLSFPSNLAPIVGQQTTLAAWSPPATGSRITLLRERADAGECELIAKAGGYDEIGYVYTGLGLFRPDRQALPPIPDAVLRLVALLTPVTYTCVPPGSGVRLGVDRDGDGFWDGDERAAHTDPANPGSHP